MVFSKDLNKLLLVPEGKEGAAMLPDQTQAVPVQALSHSAGLTGILVGEGSATYASENGILYSKDLKTLVACPGGYGNAVVIPKSVETIGADAFVGCELKSLVVLGNVSTIDPVTFSDKTKSEAIVAIATESNYDAHKAIWESAGFSKFSEPAKPGDSFGPEGDVAEVSGFAYTLLDDLTLAVSWQGATEPEANLVIPSSAEIKGVSYRLSAIAPRAFEGRTITSAVVPATITSVGDAAFARCSALSSVSLPEGLVAIGPSAFEFTALEQIVLPTTLSSIGEYAFANTSSLVRIIALTDIDDVSDSAIEGCASLSVLTPFREDGVYAWNPGIFALGNHVEPYGIQLSGDPLKLEVGQSARLFEDGHVEVPEGCELAFTYAATAVSVDGDGLVTGKKAGEVEVVASVECDGINLAYSSKLVNVRVSVLHDELVKSTGVQLPSRLPLTGLEISLEGFSKFIPETFEAPVAGGNTLKFTVLSKGGELGEVAVGKSDTASLSPTGKLDIPALVEHEGVTYTVTEVRNDFSGSSITSVTIPDFVSALAPQTFSECSQLKEVTLGMRLYTIPMGVFAKCENLTDVFAKSSVYSIDNTAFEGVASAQIKVYPATGMSVSEWTRLGFSVQKAMHRVILTPGGKNAPTSIMVEPGQLISKPVPDPQKDGFNFTGWYKDWARTEVWNFDKDTVTKNLELCSGFVIQSGTTFYHDVAEKEIRFQVITEDKASKAGTARIIRNDHGDYTQISGHLEIPATVTNGDITYTITEIGNKFDDGSTSAFQWCSKITSVSIPETITRIGTNAFSAAASLESIEFEGNSSLVVVGTGAFASSKLATINIPDSVKVIEEDALYDVKTLESVNFGKGSSLERIEESAFRDTSIDSIELPNSIARIGSNAFPSYPKLVSIFAQSALPDISIVDGAFPVATKQNTKILLPSVSTDGKGDSFETMKAAWVSRGFAEANILPREGALPTVLNPNNTDLLKASWSLSSEGLLTVRSTEAIADFGWVFNKPELKTQHWGLVRGSVKAVDSTQLAGAPKMECWFREMPLLTDISKVKIPADTKSIADIFTASGITCIPDDFVIPEGVESVNAAFNSLKLLTEIPKTFKLPESTLSIDTLFGYNPNLNGLPEEFVIPDNVKSVRGFFREWTALTSVPDNFKLSNKIESVRSLFHDCSNLASLPEDFTIPLSIKDPAEVTGVFAGCTSLTVLPSDFSMPQCVIDVPGNTYSPFYCKTMTPLYYSGSDPVVLGASPEWWKSQNRTLITPKEGSAEFKLPSQTNGTWTTWTAIPPHSTSGLLDEPVAPQRAGQVFTLWYADEACTKPVDFSKPISDQVTVGANGMYPIFGAYAAGLYSGVLPTVNNIGTASWSLTDDGTLYVRGSGKITELGWTGHDTDDVIPAVGHWAPFRSLVKKAIMEPGMSAVSTRHWFSGMPNLIDVEKVYVPREAKSVTRMFSWSTSLASLPSDFTVPEGVTEAFSMLNACTALTSLPSSFTLPETLTNANAFFSASGLVTLPESFRLSSKIQNLRYMFYNCKSLTSLPAGFLLPESVPVDPHGMFSECVNLASLPDGFLIPDSVTNLGSGLPLDRMFENCTSLTAFPESFDFPLELANTANNPFYCDVPEGQPRVTTHYSGTSEAVLNFDWASQGRTLVANSEDRNMHEVTYKVQAPTEPFAWETRSKSLTNTSGIAANPGTPTLSGYIFTGWSTDEEGLRPFDFATKLTSAMTLYGKWIKHGGKESLDGNLPVVNDIGKAWWQLTADGSFSVHHEGGATIKNLGWIASKDDVPLMGYWSPYRSQVKRIVMQPGLAAVDADHWFSGMTQLVDISKAFVPFGATSLTYMFDKCSSLSVLPDQFCIPEGVESTSATFRDCAFSSLPENFSLPKTLTNANSMFALISELTSLPDSLRLPENLTYAPWMFVGCKSLVSLPDSFRLPSNKPLVVHKMFKNCTSLTSLPEGFTIPKNVTDVELMFSNCPNLISLPASLDLNALSDTAKTTWNDMFEIVSPTPPTIPISTYYAGERGKMPDAAWWAKQNRELVTGQLADKYMISFMLPNSDSGTQELWMTQLASKDAPMSEPAAPVRSGYAFLGWYTDDALTARFDFTQPIKSDTTLYACYYQRSGSLPTTDGQSNASWSLSVDGMLSISCTNDAVIAPLGWEWDMCTNGYWGPLRSYVNRLNMEQNVKTQNMNTWFAFMPDLVDVSSGFFVPEGCAATKYLFYNSRSLSMLPTELNLPLSLENTRGMFQKCEALSVLPDDFVLPNEVKIAGYMFEGAGIVSLPEGFLMPDAIVEVNHLFEGCKNLVSLPAGFGLPEGAKAINDMFGDCTSLTSLPVGFAIPATATNVINMFSNCPNLRVLPASLKLSGLTSVLGFNTLFALPAAITDPIPTYYAGNAADVPDQAYWATNYNRTLSTQSDPIPEGTHRVTFKVEPAGTTGFVDWTTVLTDKAGKAPNPGIPTQFGYAFLGWYKDEACSADQKFNFETDVVTANITLYGKYTLIVRYEVPLAAKISIDAMGKTTPVPVQMKSFTPVPLRVSMIACTESPEADEVFPDAATRKKLAIQLTPKDGGAVSLGFKGFGSSRDFRMDAAQSAAAPGTLDYTVGLSIPDFAKINYFSDGWTTGLATLAYTVEPE